MCIFILLLTCLAVICAIYVQGAQSKNISVKTRSYNDHLHMVQSRQSYCFAQLRNQASLYSFRNNNSILQMPLRNK
jgi:hypothetical protein